MPESVALSWRGRLADDYAVNLPIVLDDGLKLPNRWVTRQLRGRGWKVIRIWQRALEKSPDACLNRIRRALAD